jgi:hypothetical protein
VSVCLLDRFYYVCVCVCVCVYWIGSNVQKCVLDRF